MAHLAADRSQPEDREQALSLALEHHLRALVLLGEFHDGLGWVADQHVNAVRHAGFVEHADRSLQHSHARIPVEIAQIRLTEEARHVARQRTLYVEQVDMHRLLAVARDRLLGRPAGIAERAHGDEYVLHGYRAPLRSAAPGRPRLRPWRA